MPSFLTGIAANFFSFYKHTTYINRKNIFTAMHHTGGIRMGDEKGYRFETEIIHKGYDSNQFHGSLVPPIFQSSTFTFPNAESGEKRFSGEEDGYIYSRLGNPTVKMLEER